MYHCIGFGEGQNQVSSRLIIRGDKNLEQIAFPYKYTAGNLSVKVRVRYSI